jgi:hypothetical protein
MLFLNRLKPLALVCQEVVSSFLHELEKMFNLSDPTTEQVQKINSIILYLMKILEKKTTFRLQRKSLSKILKSSMAAVTTDISVGIGSEHAFLVSFHDDMSPFLLRSLNIL